MAELEQVKTSLKEKDDQIDELKKQLNERILTPEPDSRIINKKIFKYAPMQASLDLTKEDRQPRVQQEPLSFIEQVEESPTDYHMQI